MKQTGEIFHSGLVCEGLSGAYLTKTTPSWLDVFQLEHETHLIYDGGGEK